VRDCLSGSTSCYDDQCTAGICFFGDFSAGDDRIDCEPSSAVPSLPVWKNNALNVWNTASRNQIANVGSPDATAEYIIEFLCFVEKGDGTKFNAASPNEGAPLYRITSLAKSQNLKAQVMLQSTYRLSD
jgi:Tfp pilus assembly protein PilX